MAPELRKRKSKDAGLSAAKPASKGKAGAPATKRKAPDDASPVAVKKSKPAKTDGLLKAKTDRSTETKTSKKQRSTKAAEKEDTKVPSEDEDAQSSEDEQDNAQALAKIVDSDDEDAVVDTDIAFQEGQDVGEIPKASKDLLKSSKSGDGEPGVVYIGRLPHGFFEHEMRSYFSQFGKIERLRMSRNKKTGASKHFAFIEFAEAAVAEVVVKTMDNYLLFGRILKVKLVPKSQIHEDMWKGSNKRFKNVPRNKLAGNHLKKPLTESTWSLKIAKEEQKRKDNAKKLLELGYEFEGPKLKSVDEAKDTPALEGANDEAPEAIEAAPEAVGAEEETNAGNDESQGDDLAVKEPVKASKKGKKSSKGKKRSA